MTFQSKAGYQPARHLEKRDLAEYGVARLRDQFFDAVLTLWRRRKAEGWTQRDLADKIGRDPAWVSRKLSAPGNWTLVVAGEFVQGLSGEAEIKVTALGDAPDNPRNYDAYDGYRAEATETIEPPAQGEWLKINQDQIMVPITKNGFGLISQDMKTIFEKALT